MTPIPSIIILAGLAFAVAKVLSPKKQYAKELTAEEVQEIVLAEAQRLQIDPAAAFAILSVESSGSGFKNGKLVIRFEDHIFRRLSGLDWKSPSYPKSVSYQDIQWDKLSKAFELNKSVALQSISMGSPQIMGFNHLVIGYKTPDAMWVAFNETEAAHILALFRFFENYPGLLTAVRKKDWARVSSLYNGDKTGTYEGKFKAAYSKWSKTLGAVA